jgi:hypothetical protein
MIAAAPRNGIPKRSVRSYTKPAILFRCRLFHTNKPETKNMSDMKKVSLNPTMVEAPTHFSGSTMGNACHHRGGAAKDGATGGVNVA